MPNSDTVPKNEEEIVTALLGIRSDLSIIKKNRST